MYYVCNIFGVECVFYFSLGVRGRGKDDVGERMGNLGIILVLELLYLFLLF